MQKILFDYVQNIENLDIEFYGFKSQRLLALQEINMDKNILIASLAQLLGLLLVIICYFTNYFKYQDGRMDCVVTFTAHLRCGPYDARLDCGSQGTSFCTTLSVTPGVTGLAIALMIVSLAGRIGGAKLGKKPLMILALATALSAAIIEFSLPLAARANIELGWEACLFPQIAQYFACILNAVVAFLDNQSRKALDKGDTLL